MDFHHVQQYKLMRNILDTPVRMPCNQIASLRRKIDTTAVERDFLITDCEKCGTKRPNPTWSKLDFVSMAKRAGSISKLIVPGYFVPLRHAHSTFGGLSDRLEIVDNRVQFRRESSPEVADKALMTAHHCILHVLEVQNKRFTVDGLQEQCKPASGISLYLVSRLGARKARRRDLA